MRLTLRTLLAFRDGVLDPKDAAALETKILDSSTAQRISRRIADEMQNRRLAPIPVDAREFGFEANLVAEFLDDTIPMETLPEMERKCLENNTLLSEIGSCHQILSRALTIPAPVAASLRQRIHNLPNELNARPLASKGKTRRVDARSLVTVATQTGDGSQHNSIALTATKSIRKPNVELRGTGIELHDGLGRQVPEYLIGRDHGWLKNAALASLLLGLFVIVGAFAIGPLERVRNLLRKSNGGAVASVVEKTRTNDSAESNGTMVPPKRPVESSNQAESVDPQPDIVESSAPPPMPTTAVSKSSEKASIELPSKSSIENTVGIVHPLTANAKGRMQWLPDTKASSESIVLKLLTSETHSPYWTRMSPGEYVNIGERIVVPPTQRTEFRVDPGIRLLCAGDNHLELVNQNDTLKVNLHSGRVLVFATPDARAITIDMNGLELLIRFASADGSCALDVQNIWSPLTEELSERSKIESRTLVRLIGVEGELTFASKHSTGQVGSGALTVGQFIDWKQGNASVALELAETPWWFRTSVSRPIDQLASTDLQRTLTGRAPGQLETELLELTKHRRGETAALATRTRLTLGLYDGLFEEEGILNRKGLHSHWQSILQQIPQSLARSEHRDNLLNGIRLAATNRFLSILGLIVPPSKEQLLAGSDKILVEGLSSPHMDERVLAFHQLNTITGKSLGYQPDKSQLDAITLWRRMLGKNEIRYIETTAP